MTTTEAKSTTLSHLLAPTGPACLVIKAKFEPIGGQYRFQPAGFPEMGHVIYAAPRADGHTEQVCIVDSAASMANHLESLCFANPSTGILHPDLDGLAYVRCVTDPGDRLVVTSLSEGHRLASDYFLDGKVDGKNFREALRSKFGIVEVKKDKTYFITPESWWTIYQTIFRFDPNSLIHGVFFAKEQIRISRLLTASLEAFGAARVGSSGVKFDKLGKTTSGQPIFSKDEETAERIEATFLIDLGLIRSYGHEKNGLTDAQKRLLLEFAIWKVRRMTSAPFRFRSGCHLRCTDVQYTTDSGTPITLEGLDIKAAIQKSGTDGEPITNVHYASGKLFQAEGDQPASAEESTEGEPEA